MSHYERHKNRDDNFVYTEPGCTWDKVYKLAKEEVNEFPAVKNKPKLPSQTWSYEKVKELFPHVKLHQPSKDMCSTCSKLTILGHTEEREAHQKRAENFRKQLAKDSTKKHCFAFDLQQVQSLPFIWVNKAFYRRKTWLFIFGTNYTKPKQASMYISTEM